MIKINKHIIFIIYLFLMFLGVSATAQTQDKVFDEDFKERYSGRRFDYEGNAVIRQEYNRVKGKPSTKYEKNEPIIKEDNNSNTTNFSFNGFSWLFILLFFVALVFLIFMLTTDGNTGWFTSKRTREIKDYKTIDVATASKDEFLKLIEIAENNGDFRLAIRYYFLYVLKMMSNKKIIEIEEDKTNAEYLNEIQDQNLSDNFYKILYLYNYTWYGEFSINNPQYKTAKSNFNQFIKQIK